MSRHSDHGDLLFLVVAAVVVVVVVGITKRGVVEDLYNLLDWRFASSDREPLYSLQVQNRLLTSNTTIIL